MRAPDLKGAAEAWIMPIPNKKVNGDAHATIRHWMVRGKFHAFWNTWIVTMSHLRDTPGLDKANKSSPDMTHEFMTIALDPGMPPGFTEYDPDNIPFPIPYLKPIDCVVQFKCESDAQASDILDSCVKLMSHGLGTPDRDGQSYWEKAIPATVECSKHPEKGLN